MIFADGEQWKEHRRFILTTFRDFGVGKLGMEEKIVEETKHLIQSLRNSDSNPIDNKVALATTVANVIASVLTGERYDEDNPVFRQYIFHVSAAFQQSPARAMLVCYITVIENINLPHFYRYAEEFS